MHSSGACSVTQSDVMTVFQQLRGTSQYLRVARSDSLAKVKQLGPFISFFTLSCDEGRWPEVSVSILKSLGHEVTITSPFSVDEDANILIDGISLDEILIAHSTARADILGKHVVQVTRLFNKRLQVFIRTILLANFGNSSPVEIFPIALKCSNGD